MNLVFPKNSGRPGGKKRENTRDNRARRLGVTGDINLHGPRIGDDRHYGSVRSVSLYVHRDRTATSTSTRLLISAVDPFPVDSIRVIKRLLSGAFPDVFLTLHVQLTWPDRQRDSQTDGRTNRQRTNEWFTELGHMTVSSWEVGMEIDI